jgi:hypothetical protein
MPDIAPDAFAIAFQGIFLPAAISRRPRRVRALRDLEGKPYVTF